MNKLFMKVHSYDEEMHSLIISFSTDTSKQEVEHYPKIAFNILNYNPSDINDTLRRIAIQGVDIAKMQNIKEQKEMVDEVVSLARSTVGTTYDMDIIDLLYNDETGEQSVLKE